MSETDAQLFARMRSTADQHLARDPRRVRVDGWEGRLVNILSARIDQPFVWGRSDCCLFACDVIEQLRGSDPAAWFRGRYDDHRGAVAALREFSDGGTLEDVAERIARASMARATCSTAQSSSRSARSSRSLLMTSTA